MLQARKLWKQSNYLTNFDWTGPEARSIAVQSSGVATTRVIFTNPMRKFWRIAYPVPLIAVIYCLSHIEKYVLILDLPLPIQKNHCYAPAWTDGFYRLLTTNSCIIYCTEMCMNLSNAAFHNRWDSDFPSNKWSVTGLGHVAHISPFHTDKFVLRLRSVLPITGPCLLMLSFIQYGTVDLHDVKLHIVHNSLI